MNFKNLFLLLLVSLVIVLISFSRNLIKSAGVFEVNKKINSKIFNIFDNKYVFVFFGYVACEDVCTPRLKELSDIIKLIKNEQIDINTLFVNMVDFNDKHIAQRFARQFNKDFNAVTLLDEDLKKIQNEFNIYNTASLTQDGEYNHTSYLFLLKKNMKNYSLIRIYTKTPFDKDVIIKDIKIENTK